MKAINLLEKYPEACKIIQKWFTKEFTKSMGEDDSVPEDFKEMVLQEGFTKERLAIIIDANPRSLFDVFDENEIYIVMGVIDDKEAKPLFHYHLHGLSDNNDMFKSRKEAEFTGIILAFEELENNQKVELTTINKEIEDETK